MMSRRKVLISTAATAAGAMALPVTAQQQVLTFGFNPSADPRAVIANSQGMLDKLSKAVNMPVKPFVAADYNGLIEALRLKRIDLAYLGPFAYVLGKTLVDIEAFVFAEIKANGRIFYRSQIITHKNSGIKTINDLKGKSFAYVDPSSASGHLLPKAGLIKLGFDPDNDFGRVIYSGSHDANAIAVQNKKVDAAATGDRLLDGVIARGLVRREDITVIWQSDPIPGSPMVWRKDLPADLKKRIRAAFLEAKDITWHVHGMLNGFKPTTDADYNIIRETAQLLNLDLKTLK
ncbi:phosphonate transport system substrate-binding protein [Polaromonas sp. YR568]|uniref:phosphate/phosphite/phosphonate ABC transporter substrate-binding protein n=1 Tax=Polaromonas sp. YR568 TaxID=1855301 RepID=UPI0008EE2026|nr:phosphate/phosphite/phosphonate ABC transporter substrate-binding protein [Polaromonas sp. YR568]SFU96814.1 phosphonate transport system substrate-binding protein [Polaromonas sp. YR568]